MQRSRNNIKRQIRDLKRKIVCFTLGHHWKCLIKRNDGTQYCAWCGAELTMYPRMRYCKENEIDRYLRYRKIREES
jgi:transcription elongation factor Elf1